MGRQWTAVKPRANPPICWLCDKRLYAGGKAYVLIQTDEGGVTRPAHRTCADEEGIQIVEQTKEGDGR